MSLSDTYENYAIHINQEHAENPITIVETEINHGNFEELKSNLENRKKTKFVIRNSKIGYQQYICQHTITRPRKASVEFEREPKLNRIKKDYTCPAFIKVIDKLNGKMVKYCNNHIHETYDYFLQMDDECRHIIERKLKMGIKEKEILNQMKVEKSDFIISMKDIQNVKLLKKIGDVSYDTNDKISCSNFNNDLFDGIY